MTERATCNVEGCDDGHGNPRPAKRGGGGACAHHYKPRETFPAESLRPEEVVRLLAATGEPRETDIRNKALISFLLGTGVRIAEALDVTPVDLNTDRGSVFIRHGKGDKPRLIAIRRSALRDLVLWRIVRNGYPQVDSLNPLFCTKVGGRLDDRYVRRMFTRLGKKAGIERHVHPHAMRHTFAVEATREGVSPANLQRQLGHSNLGTTTRYISTISADEVIDAFAALDRKEDV